MIEDIIQKIKDKQNEIMNKEIREDLKTLVYYVPVDYLLGNAPMTNVGKSAGSYKIDINSALVSFTDIGDSIDDCVSVFISQGRNCLFFSAVYLGEDIHREAVPYEFTSKEHLEKTLFAYYDFVHSYTPSIREQLRQSKPEVFEKREEKEIE